MTDPNAHGADFAVLRLQTDVHAEFWQSAMPQIVTMDLGPIHLILSGVTQKLAKATNDKGFWLAAV